MRMRGQSAIAGMVIAGALALGGVSASVAASGPAAAEQRGLGRRAAGAPADQPGIMYSRADAEVIAQRLYRAVLGRAGEAQGATVIATEIQRGNLRTAINNMLSSPEFVQNHQSKPPAILLDQFYQGLLQRAPDSAGVQTFMPRMEQHQYADVLMQMIGANEFRSVLSNAGSAGGGGIPSRLDAALECQGRVIDKARRDVGGRIFMTFDRLPDVSDDGRTVSGPAVDRFEDKDRQLTYRCSGSDVTYAYADRQPPTKVDARVDFPSAAVRGCQAAVRPGLIFEAASLSATDTNTEYVLGVSGGTVHRCQMDVLRVVSVN